MTETGTDTSTGRAVQTAVAAADLPEMTVSKIPQDVGARHIQAQTSNITNAYCNKFITAADAIRLKVRWKNH